jgi:(E)-benzylidenesuccinyl-CoA hydratase
MIDFELTGGIATITMNRPEKMNALDTPDLKAFIEALHRVREEPEILVAIITGAGDKSFTSGMDWKVLDEDDMPWTRYRDVPDGLLMNMQAYFKGIEIWKPVIAAVNGHALGLGAHVLVGADLRIASTNATCAFHEVHYGDTANGGGIARLTRQIPYCHAMDLLITGRRVDAATMERMGLVNEVVEPERLMPRAREIAQYIIDEADQHAVQITKRTVIAGLDMGQTQAMHLEAVFTEMLHNLHRGHETKMFEYSAKWRDKG